MTTHDIVGILSLLIFFIYYLFRLHQFASKNLD